jgi:hypothetical protein
VVTQPGALVVRRSIWIDAGPERVWLEFETFETMKRCGWGMLQLEALLARVRP